MGTVTASQKMLTLQALSSSLNAGTAKGGCLGRGEAFGVPSGNLSLRTAASILHIVDARKMLHQIRDPPLPSVGVARGLLQERTLQFQHGNVRVHCQKLGVFQRPPLTRPNTSAKVLRYKWEAYRDTDWWCIYYFLQEEGILAQVYRDRNGGCIAILFKSYCIGVRVDLTLLKKLATHVQLLVNF